MHHSMGVTIAKGSSRSGLTSLNSYSSMVSKSLADSAYALPDKSKNDLLKRRDSLTTEVGYTDYTHLRSRIPLSLQ